MNTRLSAEEAGLSCHAVDVSKDFNMDLSRTRWMGWLIARAGSI